jgi:hypothetical protein
MKLRPPATPASEPSEDLGRLKELLTAEEPDVSAIGRTLIELRNRTQT